MSCLFNVRKERGREACPSWPEVGAQQGPASVSLSQGLLPQSQAASLAASPS